MPILTNFESLVNRVLKMIAPIGENLHPFEQDTANLRQVLESRDQRIRETELMRVYQPNPPHQLHPQRAATTMDGAIRWQGEQPLLIPSEANCMSTMRDLADDCVAALVEAFPIEDVWLLEAKAAKECELETPINLFLIVPDVSEAHVIESAALEMVRKRPEWSDIDVFAFPLSVITRIPRPLLVKMALTSGRNIYCK